MLYEEQSLLSMEDSQQSREMFLKEIQVVEVTSEHMLTFNYSVR